MEHYSCNYCKNIQDIGSELFCVCCGAREFTPLSEDQLDKFYNDKNYRNTKPSPLTTKTVKE